MIRSGVKETNILFQVNEKQDFNHLVMSQSSLYVTFREEMEDLKLKEKNTLLDVTIFECCHNGTARSRHQCRKTAVLSCHRFLINSGVEKNKQHLNMDLNFDPPDVSK